MLGRSLRFFVENRLVAVLLAVALGLWGAAVAPFDLGLDFLPRDPVAADAIPDIGENQQIVFTKWEGRSPQDVEDQVTYPLTVALLGVPGVRTIRSYSYFGFSSIYIIFDEDVEFYWSRSRVLEKLNSLPPGSLPQGVVPMLGPDATALGQVFWYTIEGRDENGEPVGGWDPDELRSVQDWFVRYALMAVDGVSEVASIGGYVREYQVDVNPDALHDRGVRLSQVTRAVADANLEVGANVLDLNGVEYFLRGRGWISSTAELEEAEVASRDGVAIRVGDVATVQLGPANRRGGLDKGGAEAVGGVVIVRYGENPMEVLMRVKEEIHRLAPSMPVRTLPDGRMSRLTIVPFYDRTGLIHETLDTLREAISHELLVTVLVVLFLLFHLRAAALVSLTLPLAVLATFILMKAFRIDANIVALSGIAIAIGTVVDMGIVLVENSLARLRREAGTAEPQEIIIDASTEVGGAVFTAIATTIVGFLPVFAMTGAEGKLFKPLAFTKTFALIGAIVVSLYLLPPLAATILPARAPGRLTRLGDRLKGLLPRRLRTPRILVWLAGAYVVYLLARLWEPLGPDAGLLRNLAFVAISCGGLLLFFHLFHKAYPALLMFQLKHKVLSLSLPVALVLLGASAWLGFDRVFAWIPATLEKVGVERTTVTSSAPWSKLSHAFPGFGKEFMPRLDEGSFLFMPATMPHASVGEVIEMNRKMDLAIESIPEVSRVVGKWGRAETAIDPAPIGMIETLVEYVPEYGVDEDGNRVRNWRDEIRSPDDIWQEILRVTKLPGMSSAPKLQPILTRIVMLQSGMRAPMGLKLKAPDLETLELAALRFEEALRKAPGVAPDSVFADRVVGKPYLEVAIDREAAARYGLNIAEVHEIIEVALGGKPVTWTVEGRERYQVRVRYQRELRDDPQEIAKLLLPIPGGGHVPLDEVAEIEYVRGPQSIKTEDTFLTAYVIFDMQEGWAEVDVVEAADSYLRDLVESGELDLPGGVTWRFAGNYENQLRAAKTLSVVLPAALFVIFLLLYFHFRSTAVTLMVFSGVFVAWAGGFLMLWLYGRPWFLDFSFLGADMQQLFQISPRNLSVAVWVGFLALFGIATDDGVIMGTYLEQSFAKHHPKTREEVREAVLEAGKRRVRPCLMTAATTILALLPVLTSTGRGADVMVPMAIPSFGGMTVVLLTMFVVPVLYSIRMERGLPRSKPSSRTQPETPTTSRTEP